ncbi:MAG: DUF4337 domain-containing protein [Thaumarchaeota archaeon]|nr:MAG: DUF4337 domain-containing protein [Nitrososphaerota archaeon]
MHSVSGFFLIVTFFIIGLSILAVYTTTLATELGLTKDDMQTSSLTHLIKSIDWENDYNEEKIGERILKAQLDDLNITLHSNFTKKNVAKIENNFAIYKSHLDNLEGSERVNGSLLNLKHKAESEYNGFLQSVNHISNISKMIGIYELITILLIIAVGLGGVSEIARNKLLGYPAFIIGGVGVILLFMITFVPSTLT